MAPKNQLVDSSDDERDSSAPPDLAFKVNDAFAEKYDQKKRTEELSKLQDKYGKDFQLGDDDEDDETDYSTDDDDAELVTPEVDAAILRTLAKIRAKDPSVYDDGRNVFEEEEAATAAARGSASSSKASRAKGSSSSKPVLLKDYQRARLLANPEGDEALDDAADGGAVPQTHAEEQRALKREITAAFHQAGGSSDEEEGGDESEDEDGLFRPREKDDDERAREEREYERFLETAVGKKAVKQALGDDKEEAFLRSYIMNRGWIDRENDSSHVPSYDEIVGNSTTSSSSAKKGKARAASPELDADGHPLDPAAHDDDDEELDEVAEEFEHTYNFRFEETGAADLVTHARDAASSVRKPTTAVSARARAREAAKLRKEEEALQRKEELRRLKALKRKEVEERLKQLVEAAGEGTKGLEEIDLDGEWDEAKHEEAMRKVYGGEYENLEDDEFKPTWDDDIDIGDIGGDSGDDDDAALHLPYEPVASTSALPEGDGDVDMDAEAEVDEVSPKKSKKERKKEKKNKKAKRDEEGLPTDLVEAVKSTGDADKVQAVDRLVDEYYALDYEDQVGDLRTRFKYAKVPASSFNLTPEEILLATDAELNAFMSLKKLAPYRQDSAAWQAKQQQKQRKALKELRDALKTRKWGEEVDEEQAQKALDKRREKKRRYRENAEKRAAETAGEDGGAATAAAAAGGARGEDGEPPKKKKRAGKSERKRLQKEREQAGEGAQA
ncbi:KRI1-like family C-terminal-domain-containing protein [Rhodotorula diobovata]|uniref:KRI1-like family C-terminal-domain-containing protein n=1 Tax=Rhodotorula diobovata TaxID=5288 RepID=A0A5C5FQB0_9BASI|nr:KRI1-like family C-terminal-domain-containing protein [Rhodotorula diobovata]